MSIITLLLFLCTVFFTFDQAHTTTPLRGIGTPKSPVESALNVDPYTVYLFELAISFLVLLYIIVFIVGRHQNLAVAIKLSQTFCKVLPQQFAQFGDSGTVLKRDGHSFFWYYATGRRHTPGLTVSIDLANRMDMFSYTSAFMAAPKKDRLTFYLPIASDVQMDPLSLFLVRRKELTRLRSVDDGVAISAVEALAAEILDGTGIPSEFVTMTEHADIATVLLPDFIRDIITNHKNYIVSMHVTEQGAEWEPQSTMSKRLIRIECTLPYADDHQDQLISDMCQVAIYLLDTIANTKLSPAARKKASDMRKLIIAKREKQEQKARAEEAAARRLEKKKEEEEAVGKMSAEKQRKYEERKRKKEINTRMRKASSKR